jgi:Flp pilus assembly protein CpaB
MKWAVFFLCLLGVMAAACAAFLVQGIKLSAIPSAINKVKPDDNTEVQVLIAARTIPAMTVVDSRLVMAKNMLKKDAPPDFISNTVEVVGKVLAKPVVEGQSFTSSCFAGDSASRLVAEAIPKGKRAVGISVTDYAGLEGMLYPGSTVDVMASFKAQGSEDWRSSSTTTLLENVQVLGIEQQTVVSPGKTMADTANMTHTRRVTLLVDTKQAKVLQLAMEQGTLSLAMRNPMDDSNANRDSVSLAKLLGGHPPPPISDSKMEKSDDFWDRFARAAIEAQHRQQVKAATGHDPFGPSTQPAAPPPPQWEITVIRGESTSTQRFPMPTTKPAEKSKDILQVEGEPVTPMSMSR